MRPSWPSCAAGPRAPEPIRSGRWTICTGPTPSARRSPPWPWPPRPRPGRPSGPACCSCPCGSRPPWRSRRRRSSSSRAAASSWAWASAATSEEYERAGVDFHRRGRLMDEGVGRPAAGLGPVRTGLRLRPGAGGTPRPAVVRRGERRGPAPGRGRGRRLDPACSSRPDDYAPAVTALRREATEAGRDPGAVETGVVVFACVGDDDAAARGAAWLSQLYRLPAKAFGRHLVGGVAGCVCRRPAPLRRGRRAPHRRHGGRVTRRGALRPVARRLRPGPRSGSSRGHRHERDGRRHPRDGHDGHEPARSRPRHDGLPGRCTRPSTTPGCRPTSSASSSSATRWPGG